MTAPSRPVLRWYGGKWMLAPWIIEHLPRHKTYVEPFGGAASVLLRKKRSYAEIYNDLDSDVVNLFRVMRDDAAAARLQEQLRLTPFCRKEFEASFDISDDPVERARRLVVRSFQGFGANAHVCDLKGRNSTGFRASSNRSGSTPARDWRNYPDAMKAMVDRLQGVVIESRDAKIVMATNDGPATVHYVDPPYVWETRSGGSSKNMRKRMYRHDMEDAAHVELLDFLKTLEGMVVLSGYSSPLYERELESWTRVEREAFADGARPRTEVLWMNSQAYMALLDERVDHRSGNGTPLFSGEKSW